MLFFFWLDFISHSSASALIKFSVMNGNNFFLFFCFFCADEGSSLSVTLPHFNHSSMQMTYAKLLFTLCICNKIFRLNAICDEILAVNRLNAVRRRHSQRHLLLQHSIHDMHIAFLCTMWIQRPRLTFFLTAEAFFCTQDSIDCFTNRNSQPQHTLSLSI